jgi:hypothetical protein
MDKLTEKEKKDPAWVPLTVDQHLKAKGMNRAQRRRYAKQLRKEAKKVGAKFNATATAPTVGLIGRPEQKPPTHTPDAPSPDAGAEPHSPTTEEKP